MLELLGIEPEIGAKFTLTFDVDGRTTTKEEVGLLMTRFVKEAKEA